jgi:hypothetical protein
LIDIKILFENDFEWLESDSNKIPTEQLSRFRIRITGTLENYLVRKVVFSKQSLTILIKMCQIFIKWYVWAMRQ